MPDGRGVRIGGTGAAFLAYFAMSGMLAPIGLIAPELAQTLGLELTDATSNFSWLTLGILVGSGLALVVLTVWPLRWLLAGVYALAGTALLVLRWFDSAALVWPALGVVGVCFGVGLAGAALTISRLYAEDSRASMLVVTDACFSIAGTVIAACAVRFIAAGAHWASTYLIVAFVCGLITLIAIAIRIPETAVDEIPNSEETEKTEKADSSWPLGLWLCIVSLFLYTLGQYAMLWWLPNHLTGSYGVTTEVAGSVVGRFWTGMLCAQLFVAWWVYRIGVQNLVTLGSLTTVLASLPLWLVGDMSWLPWLALLWGFANLGLLKTVLTLGTLTLRAPTPTAVSALLFGATGGTAASPWLTSQIVAIGSELTALQFSSACYAALAVLLLVARRHTET